MADTKKNDTEVNELTTSTEIKGAKEALTATETHGTVKKDKDAETYIDGTQVVPAPKPEDLSDKDLLLGDLNDTAINGHTAAVVDNPPVALDEAKAGAAQALRNREITRAAQDQGDQEVVAEDRLDSPANVNQRSEKAN